MLESIINVNANDMSNKIPNMLYNFSSVFFWDAFGMCIKLILFESHIPIIPKTNDELMKLKKYLISIREVIGIVSG